MHDLVRAVDRTGATARQAILSIARRLIRLAWRIALLLVKAIVKWVLFVILAACMDALAALRFRHYVTRPIRRLRASLRHSTDWHGADFDGRRMEVRRLHGSDCLQIRMTRGTP